MIKLYLTVVLGGGTDLANFSVVPFGSFLLEMLPLFQLFGVRERDSVNSL